MVAAENDRKILRALAEEYRRLSEECDFDGLVKLYKGVNDLHMTRPVVLINEVPWHEMNFDGSLTLRCEDKFLRGVEKDMRQKMFQWKHFRADNILPPYIPVTKVVINSGYGMDKKDTTLVTEGGGNVVSHSYEDQLANPEDVDKLVLPVIKYDKETTLARVALLEEIFGDIIPVKVVGLNTYLTIWDPISRLRGVTAIYYDLVDRPEHMHRIAQKFVDIHLATIRQYEEENLFEPYPLYLHCTAACTDDLRSGDLDHVKAMDCWGRGQAQVFAEVSRDMHLEFDINYIKQVFAKFGLVYYGCCEPLHHKIDLIEQIPRLRKISITPWADVEIAAGIMGEKYVMSNKPNPANVAVNFDVNTVKAEVNKTINACYKNNVSFELVLKDISTVGGNPQNLIMWEKTVMEMVKSI